jgi:hypothetical protein
MNMGAASLFHTTTTLEGSTMRNIMLGIVLCAGAMTSASAGDGKPVSAPPPPRQPSSCDCDKGFFHPFTKFWVRTVGGTVGDGLKGGAHSIKHGIGG